MQLRRELTLNEDGTGNALYFDSKGDYIGPDH